MKNTKNSDTLIIIPVFNEGENIGKVLQDLFTTENKADILVVNDGSFDKTSEILETSNVFTVTHAFNLGIGASFETGCQFAAKNEYEYIVRMDGDRQHDAIFIKDILTPVKNKEVDVAVGSRFLGNSEFTSSRFRLIGIWIISFILTLMTKRRITDPTSGFCAMNKKAFEFFSRNCAEDFPEPEILIYHKNFRIKEIPILINKRDAGYSSITPLKSIYYMIKVLLSLLVYIFRKKN